MERKTKTLSVLLLFASATLALGQEAGHLGVYAIPQDVLSPLNDTPASGAREEVAAVGAPYAFAPKDALEFEVSVANEDGGQALLFPEALGSAFNVVLSVDGQVLRWRQLQLTWGEEAVRFSTSPGEPGPEPSDDRLLEPGVGKTLMLTVRRRDGEPFGAGEYYLDLRVRPLRVRTPGGALWTGRGGRGGAEVELREVGSTAQRVQQLLLAAATAQQDKRLDEALELYAAAEKLSPPAPEAGGCAYFGRAVVLYELGRFEEALPCFEAALAAAPPEPGLLPQVLASTYLALGQETKAFQVLEDHSDAGTALGTLEVLKDGLRQRGVAPPPAADDGP